MSTATQKLVRFVTLAGKPSPKTYLLDQAGPDRLGHIRLFGQDGDHQKVHRQRVIPEDSLDKAIGIGIGDRIRVVCPIESCTKAVTLEKQHAICPEHGTYEVLLQGAKPKDLINTKPKRQIKKKSRKELSVNERREPTKLDLQKVLTYGELWSRKGDFDHPTIELRCYILLAENPPRKLVFNTYNGLLNKKSRDPIAELKLDAFQANDNVTCEKKIISLENLDAERKAIVKKLYTKVE